jgi:hypothetical protein
VIVRVLQVFAVTIYIFLAIGSTAYFGLSFFWLVPLLAPALYFIFHLPDISPSYAPYEPHPGYREGIEARIEQLKNGPPHRNKIQYIDNVSRGIPYSDERIDYIEFPDRLVLCEHLQPVESAMRAAALPMDHIGKRLVAVNCRLQTGRIARRFRLPACVEFGTGPGPDNHAPDVQVIRCRQCGDQIEETLFGGPWPEG